MNIWTNGCYDIIHAGHIRLFEYAKSLGNILYVGIDSDRRVKQLKGPNRPINNQNNRKLLLSSIKFIDSVDIFDSEYELESLLQKHNIDIIVVGDDYKNKNVVGSKLVKSVIFFPRIPNLSSSELYESAIN